MQLLYPSDPFTPRLVDEAFREEADAVQQAGFEVVPLNIDDLTTDPTTALRRLKAEGKSLLYRGWMLSNAAYSAMEAEVKRRNCRLITSASAYESAHELPSWYGALTGFTPASTWTTGESLDDLVTATYELKVKGPVVLKDYVKSEKHRWLEAAFVPDVADEQHLRTVGAKLREYRGDEFTGGFVVRDFEQFEGHELRTWWVNGALACTTAHPDTPDQLPEASDLGQLEGPIESLGLPFITVDVIRRFDGQLRVVEIGDGQVSDRPRSLNADRFVGSLLKAFGQS